MANQYKNKVVYNGTTLIDLSDTTAVQSDVASGKYFYLATGEKVEGTGGGDEPSGPTYVNIVPEQTFTPSNDYNLLTFTELLVVGETYRYIVNGVEKTGVAADFYGSIVLGSYTDYNSGTGGAFECANNNIYYDTKLRTAQTVQVDRVVEGSGGGGGSSDSNPLKGKIAAFTGDSLCAGAGYTGGYAGIIGTDYDMTVQNIGTSEGTIVRYQSYFCISESISSLRSDADFVLLEGGGNDAWYGTQVIPLGTLSSGYSATLDTTTFAGAFESMLKSTIARFPNAKIGYIFPHKCIANFDSPNGTYRNMAISALEKWGIPYCDLNISVPPLGYIDDLKSTYTAGDGIHPNELGYRTFYVPKIVAFMQTMLTDKTLVNKTITENGTYLALDDSVDGYDSVTVNVAGGGGVTRTNIVPEQTITGSGWLTITASELLVSGQDYAYTYDGEERIGTAITSGNNTYLGDADAYWGNVGGAFGTDGQSMYVICNVEGTHTVKIDKIELSESGGGEGGSSTLITKIVTANGTYLATDDDADGYSSVTVNVSSGASNIVIGTFKGTTTGAAMDVDLAYTGNGYPIAVMIFPSDADASTFQSTIQRYAVRSYMMDKYDKTSAPVYTGSTADDYAAPVLKYKSSTTNSRSLSSGGATNATTKLYVDESATADISTLVKIRSNKKLSVFIASTSYGFMANIEYSYIVIYSS